VSDFPATAPTVGEDPEALLALAVAAARGAGALLRERYEAGPERSVHAKSTPTDLVSEADLAAERSIHDVLEAARPHDGFLGEESGEGSAGDSGLRWVVDPLDGTINYLFSIPQWCVSVAVQDEQGTLAGAIFDPLRDELHTALRGGAPMLNGRPVSASRRDRLEEAMVATGFAYDASVRSRQADVLTRLLPRVRDVRRLGSAALDLAWTAAGRYDAYFERTTKPWDVAAGALLCACAGLEVLDLDEHPGLPGGILAAPAALAGPLLELVG